MKKIAFSDRETTVLREIRNSLISSGRCPSLRGLMIALGYRSPRSASLVVNKLISKGILRRNLSGSLQIIKNLGDKSSIQTVDIPLLGVVSCGIPVFAEENILATFPVSIKLAQPPHKYFFVRAKGDSMDKKGIKNGDFVLVRKQSTADSGNSVIALVDNEVTIKEYCLSNDMVILKPRSSNKAHKPIIVTNDFQVQGVVVKAISDLEA